MSGDVTAYKGLLDQVDRDVVGWQPEAGDRLFGRVLDIQDANSEYGSYPLIVIDSPEYKQLVGLHCFHATLRNAVEAQINRGNLVIGSSIAVSYKGLGEATKGNSAPNMYRVAVQPPSES